MSWNYRVLKHVTGHGEPPQGETCYEVHEVYYNKDGTVRGWTARAVSPCGESAKEFRGSWMLYQGALKQPVVVIRDGKPDGEERPIR